MPDSVAAVGTAERVAVIDVGSNSVRLVIFGDSARAPLNMLNEKAFCALGKGLPETGHLSPEGVQNAIATLKRFAWMMQVTGVDRTVAFATSAVRDAVDGPEFVERVRNECGITLEVLSGQGESRMAAFGVLFGLPEAEGIVGDLGGSSLELASIGKGRAEAGVTLPVGPLRFDDGDAESGTIRKAVRHELRKVEWLDSMAGRDFYVVGGTWRALAKLDIQRRNYPLHIVQGYEMPLGRAQSLVDLISQQSPASLTDAETVSKRRLPVLPLACSVLGAVLERLQPRRLVFSAHGVREGAYLETLSDADRRIDPLLAAAEAMAAQETRFGASIGHEIFAWCNPLFEGESEADTRLRRVSSVLSDIGWRMHPDYRATHAFRRVLRAPLLGVDHTERAFIATTVLRRYSHKASGDAVEEMQALLSDEMIRRASRIGAAMRLAQTLGCGAPSALTGATVALDGDGICLSVPERLRDLIGETVESRLKRLADSFECSSRIVSV